MASSFNSKTLIGQYYVIKLRFYIVPPRQQKIKILRHTLAQGAATFGFWKDQNQEMGTSIKTVKADNFKFAELNYKASISNCTSSNMDMAAIFANREGSYQF